MESRCQTQEGPLPAQAHSPPPLDNSLISVTPLLPREASVLDSGLKAAASHVPPVHLRSPIGPAWCLLGDLKYQGN